MRVPAVPCLAPQLCQSAAEGSCLRCLGPCCAVSAHTAMQAVWTPTFWGRSTLHRCAARTGTSRWPPAAMKPFCQTWAVQVPGCIWNEGLPAGSDTACLWQSHPCPSSPGYRAQTKAQAMPDSRMRRAHHPVSLMTRNTCCPTALHYRGRASLAAPTSSPGFLSGCSRNASLR